MMESSPSKMNVLPTLPSPSTATAGVKRPAPTLLPAFEMLSSSPGYPRPSKRRARSPAFGHDPAFQKYPTPIPTSTTGIISSSPPRIHPVDGQRRPGLQRSQSITERAPLSSVPLVALPEDGSELLMGRSSNSSHYQLSANRLISRVHVKARYIAATVPLEPNKVEIICTGWNGAKLHCQGRTWELAKGDSFTSETENAEIMLDVQDSRVLLGWPRNDGKGSVSAQAEDSAWDDEGSPRVRAVTSRGQLIFSSPIRREQHRIRSPVSPTPAGLPTLVTRISDLISDGGEETFVQVYEDESSPNEEPVQEEELELPRASPRPVSKPSGLSESPLSDLSEPEEEDPDEENDPLVHSFGPFGANLSSRMASFTAGSPEVLRRPALSRTASESTNEADAIPVINHVVNQLAFSRLSSTPLSVIMNNLPTDLKGASSSHRENKGLTKQDLRRMLNAARCIGEIHREGKDAAGKPLESEYYYVPDEDTDEQRRAAVVDGLRKPSLRNCRKQHKQYYWKKPRTP
ncbi:transcription factor tos4 [Phlyctema vagabunda]|uniref:Transcription factor tos4 n=1 Tax=Phlyctema vagabunda TaxID=108571 RepID=A0ABR4PVY0_9HELO